jgi:hypothetical protein
MRTKGSKTAKRHWHASRVADDGSIWNFNGKNAEYPKKWELKLLDNVKYNDDTKEEKKEPGKIDFYERFGPYMEWSVPQK